MRIVNGLLDKAKGKKRIDVVDDYAYTLPVTVICRIMGVPLKDEPLLHGWIADFMAGVRTRPGRGHGRRAAPQREGRRWRDRG